MSKFETGQRAQILIEALPYIKRYSGETVVVKYGGNAMINEELKLSVISDIVLMQLVGINVVLVHGGGPEISSMLDKIGKKSKFINGLRYTDKETMDIVQQVLAGKVNKDIVQLVESYGGKAVGLCGLDGSLLQAKKNDNEDLGFVGDVVQVNTDIIKTAQKGGYIPVISTVATGVETKQGEMYNVNADNAAAQIAAALDAKKLLLMTDIKGLLRDKDDENTLIAEVSIDDIKELKQQGVISGGMIPKVDCCKKALDCGVKKVNIIDGRVPHALLIEIFTDEGIGTMFYR